MLLCAGRRVINRSEIPSSVVRNTHFLVGFAPFRGISQFIAKHRYTMQNFDSVISQLVAKFLRSG